MNFKWTVILGRVDTTAQRLSYKHISRFSALIFIEIRAVFNKLKLLRKIALKNEKSACNPSISDSVNTP